MAENYFSSCEMLESTDAVETYLRNYWQQRSQKVNLYSPQLVEAVSYSLFSGGKRFRPLLTLTTNANAVAYAAAVEMIHTYSLIHDDLPCMDNDEFRRGQPTNHKKYGEALALLAGDALLTESFFLIAEAYQDRPAIMPALIQCLARAAGSAGMIGGQAMDMSLGQSIKSVAEIETIHLGKTAELISAAIEGAGIIEGASQELLRLLREVGLCLGLCFQIKDDLLDGVQDVSGRSFLKFLSVDQTTERLEQETRRGCQLVERLPKNQQKLLHFFTYNIQRTK